MRASDLARVSYRKPHSNSLRKAGETAEVASFEGFRVEKVYDVIPLRYRSGGVVQTAVSPNRAKVVLYFDEVLDAEPAFPDTAIDQRIAAAGHVQRQRNVGCTK